MSMARASSWPTHFERLKLSTARFMYILGDWRSATLLPCANRSRSRRRIFSRSSATAFIRLPSVSGASSGIASVSTVAPAAMAAKIIASVLMSINCRISDDISAPSEVEVDHLAHDENADQHPTAAAGEHHASHRVGPQQLDVSRARDPDQRHHRDRQRPDNGRRGLGFHRHGLDFRLHLLAVAEHARKIAKCFRQIAAGFLLDRHHDAEEIRLWDRHAFEQLETCLTDGHADGLCLDDADEFAAHRLYGIGGDQLEAVEQRQAGLDAADDDIDRVRKPVEELRFAA